MQADHLAGQGGLAARGPHPGDQGEGEGQKQGAFPEAKSLGSHKNTVLCRFVYIVDGVFAIYTV